MVMSRYINTPDGCELLYCRSWLVFMYEPRKRQETLSYVHVHCVSGQM